MKIRRMCHCLIWFPLDLMRFTIDLWRFSLEGLSLRMFHGQKEQPCIYCRGMDIGSIPRLMTPHIRYRNLWMPKLVNSHLTIEQVPGRSRPHVTCMNEGGYIPYRWRTPFLAVVLTCFWMALAFEALWITNVIPPEVKDTLLARLP